MPTIKDVAREAGVSIATVSYVLNNKVAGISDATCKQVWEAVERIGYRPNVTARNLRSSQSRLIGYAWHEVPANQINSVLDRFTYYLARAAEAAGYHILTFTYPPDSPIAVYDELIRTGRVDAFVVGSTILNDPRIRFLCEQEFPFVSFGRSNPDWDFMWVDTDGRRGIISAVEHLVGLGHQRIAIAAWPEDSLSGELRLKGYVSAMKSAHLPIDARFIFRGQHSEQTGRDALDYWMSLPNELAPTAVVAVSDLMAIGVMNEAEQRGLVIGHDLSVIGFDDAPMSQYTRPALTTLQQPIPEIAAEVVAMLEYSMSKHSAQPELAPRPRHALLPPNLIVRESCGAPIR